MTIKELQTRLEQGESFLCAKHSRAHSQAVKLSLVDKAHLSFADGGLMRIASPLHPRFGKKVSSPAKGKGLAESNAHLERK